jgi:hypothetical protein
MAAPKTNKNDGDRQQYLWNYVLTVIVAAAMGAGITWIFTSQRSTPAVHPVFASPTPVTQPDASPDVTGMSPSQASLVLANFAYDHQRWPEAIRRYQEAISSGIDNADVHTDLGNAYRFSGQPEEALNQYTIAQRLNPQHENSLFNQISLFAETLNQPGRAVPICEEFIRRFPASDKIPAVQQQLARAKGTTP